MKGFIMVVLFFMIALLSMAQEQAVQYYDKSHKKTNNKADANSYTITTLQRDGSTIERSYTMGDTLTSEKHYQNFAGAKEGKYLRNGVYRYWHLNGQLASEAIYIGNELEGKRTTWHENGQVQYEEFYVKGNLQDALKGYYNDGKVRRLEVYKAGKMVKGEVYSREGGIIPYVPASELPEFPGGETKLLKFLSTNVKYPKSARPAKVSGIVILSFTVGKDGTIEGIKFEKKVHPDLDAEALRVVQAMPNWKPGTEEGEIVPTVYTLPIRFTIR
ncbi:energy transducer TonB [Pontibacter sp. SGAir0037]|uniref:energy transducer TonB n=1 Tax=Pontibacter sp. SGAir0037 TaxID=2571030 RepID=UPI0010CCB806|nr:energy transducer TonB [Pontibacter sp. SGAir0037]QCR24014.1 hypothetical protein C1N53_17750 [Pontibacter sp. SGAir0037]